jgi:transposase
MTKSEVEVITSVQRRRYWSRAEKERIVAAALEPGAVASEVARAAGIHTSQLFRWRQQLCERAQIPAAFNPVAIAPEPGSGSPPEPPELAGVIEIEFACGGRMRITGPVAASTVKALIAVLTLGTWITVAALWAARRRAPRAAFAELRWIDAGRRLCRVQPTV